MLGTICYDESINAPIIRYNNVFNHTPGAISFSTARVEEECYIFKLPFSPNRKITIVNYLNKENKCVYDKKLIDLNTVDLGVYFGILLLACLYRSPNNSNTSICLNT